ncbi:MAG: Omp28-related outer membrane protein [Flavobacteriales bacterium]
MKTTINIFLAIMVFFTSCNYIKDPLVPVAQVNENCDTIFNFSPTTNTKKNVLIEDFTGHNCNNCPTAAAIATNMSDSASVAEIIVVALHADVGAFNSVQNNPDGSYSTDWRTEEAIQIFNYFVPGSGLPAGMINRIQTAGNYNVLYWNWASFISNNTGYSQPADVSIQSKAEMLSDRTICLKVEVEFLNSMNGNYRVASYLVEDSIVDWQKMPNNSNNPNYLHRHVKRDMFGHIGINEGNTSGTGNIWGDEIPGSTFNVGDKFRFISSLDKVKASWKKQHLYVVTFVFDNNTKEIIQVIEKKVSY